MSKRCASARVLTVGALVLLVGWLISPGTTPLYDGIGFPDEPYRYAEAPPGQAPATATTPPSAARTSLTVALGVNTDQTYVTSDEQGPQVSLFVTNGLLVCAADATRIEVTVTPAHPDGPAVGSAVLGNVYAVKATSDVGPVTVSQPPNTAVVQLRAPAPPPPPAVMAYRVPGGGWLRLPTELVGTDVYQARIVGLGDYALVALPAMGAVHGAGPNLLLVGIGVLVLVMAGVVLLVRRSSPRRL